MLTPVARRLLGAWLILALFSTGLWLFGLPWWLALAPLAVGAALSVLPLVMLYIYEKRGE